MSSFLRSFVSPFNAARRLISWLISQFPDTVLIALAVLGAGLFFLAGLFLVGQWTKKPVTVNKEHIFHDGYKPNGYGVRSVHYPRNTYYTYQNHQPLQQQQHSYQYPRQVYHRSHPHPSFHHSSRYHRAQHHYARTRQATASSHHYTPVNHSSRLSPYAKHRFGKPRNYQSKREFAHNFGSGHAHAAH